MSFTEDRSARHSVLSMARRTADLINALAGDGDPAPEEIAAHRRARAEAPTA